MKNIYGMYKMEYNSAIIKNEILSFTKTWMNLEGIMLSEINQIEKDIYHMISSYRWNIKENKWKKKNKKKTKKCMHRYREQVVARREENQKMSEINKGN